MSTRREFITLLGGAASWPLAARAQQPAIPVIGYLRSTPSAPFAHLTTAFHQGLNEAGFVEGQNIVIDYRNADNQLDRLPALAGELVRRQVAVIVCNGDAAADAKAATASIPIVFTTGEDPVRQGLVTNLGRPSGNLTGVTFFGGGVLGAKRVELLHDLVPKARAIAVLIDPNYGGSDVELREVEAAGRALGRQIVAVGAAREQQFEAAFDKLLEAGADALLIAGGANFNSQRQAIIALAARHALPTMYTSRDYVAAGGLISYSASVANAYRQAGGLRRQDSQGHQTVRAAGAAADEVRAGDQPQHRQSSRLGGTGQAPRGRRRGHRVKRREFITLLGGAAVWPLAASSQQGRLPVIGVLRPNRKDLLETFAEPFRRYMKAIGWEEGRNVRFLFVWTDGLSERAPALAGELVAQNVDLIVTFGDPATRAAQRATAAIPIVALTDDMAGSGLAVSLARAREALAGKPLYGLPWGLSKVQSVNQRMRLECGVGFRQLRTCRRSLV